MLELMIWDAEGTTIRSRQATPADGLHVVSSVCEDTQILPSRGLTILPGIA